MKNKKTLAIIALTATITTLAIMYLIYAKQSSSPNNKEYDDVPTSNNTNTIVMDKDSSTNNNTKYLNFTPQALSDTVNSKRVLFFYANWCSTCRPTNEEFTKNTSSIPEGFVVIRVNYNDTDTQKEEKELASKYEITYQHTFVQIDSAGNVVSKWNGGGLDKLVQNVK